MKTLAALFLGVGIAISQASWANRDMVEVSYTGTSDKPLSQARQEIFQEAIEKTSRQYIQQIIGETKYQQNESTIKNKIVRDSGKYVLFVKSLNSKATANGGTEMTVGLKLSLQSLQQMLLKEGLLYKMTGAPLVVPLIQIQDRVAGASHSWWVDSGSKSSNALAAPLSVLHAALRDELMPLGFYLLDPLKPAVSGSLPTIFQAENLPTEDELLVGEYLGGQIVISGFVHVKASRKRSDAFELEVRLSARHTGNGRVVGEVIRAYDTDAGPVARVVPAKGKEVFPDIAKDLTAQIHDAWKSGTFGSSLIRLVVNGDFTFQRFTQLKNQILSQVTGVKTLKERKFTPGQVVFEIDSDSSADQISQNFQKAQFTQFSVQVSRAGSNQIEINVSSR